VKEENLVASGWWLVASGASGAGCSLRKQFEQGSAEATEEREICEERYDEAISNTEHDVSRRARDFVAKATQRMAADFTAKMERARRLRGHCDHSTMLP
jgi:hypothetical protein